MHRVEQMGTLLYIDYRGSSTMSWHQCLGVSAEHGWWVGTSYLSLSGLLLGWVVRVSLAVCYHSSEYIDEGRTRLPTSSAAPGKRCVLTGKKARVRRVRSLSGLEICHVGSLCSALRLDSERVGRIRRMQTLEETTMRRSGQRDVLSRL